MAADLRCSGWLSRESIYFTDHELVVLEHALSHDLVRRVRYDRLGGLLVWQSIPWDHIIVMTLFVAAPALLLLVYVPVTAAMAVSAVLLVIYLAALLRYVLFKRTYIHFVRDGRPLTYRTIASPAKIRRFRDTLVGYARYGAMG